MRICKKSPFLHYRGIRALIFFDLVKYHMEVTVTVPSKKNNLHHLHSVVSTLSVVSKVNFSHLHKCTQAVPSNLITFLITLGYCYQKNFYTGYYTKSLDFKKNSLELKIPSAVKYQCCRVPPR